MIRGSDACLQLLILTGRQSTPHEQLVAMVHRAEHELVSRITAPLAQHQQDALLSWACDAMEGVEGPESRWWESILMQKVNLRHYQIAAGEFPKWSYRDGVLVPLSLKRRKVEQRLFLTGAWALQ